MIPDQEILPLVPIDIRPRGAVAFYSSGQPVAASLMEQWGIGFVNELAVYETEGILNAMGIVRTVLIATLWSFLLAPTACLAGALDHFCPSCPETPCEHEIDCSADPCNITVIPMPNNQFNGDLPLDIDPGIHVPVEFGGIAMPSSDASPFVADPHVSLRQPLPAAFPPLRC